MAIGLIIRSGILVGAIYYSKTLGVWSDSDKTQQLYNDIKDELRPHARQVQSYLPFEIPSLPTTGEVRYLAKHYYNEGVKSTVNFVGMIPTYGSQLTKKAKDTFNDFKKSPPTE
ncbi:MICOS complex subunit MIC13 homolog QIL1-like [Teleopsis dalmanni]|uniref:MICOS complex subunit MIC13 homolog QIL1-like n=1 Tax=Teleopsis dalmanni TaxID=139649 RepID=UPI0018CE6597|nr:MICOS complex subunit MIC13 homolog QIL1-like [Teleopsis dalmanni]